MRMSIALAAVVAVVSAAVAAEPRAPQATAQSGQAQTDKKPEQKPETKAPESVAGKWTMSIESQNGTTTSALDMKVDGKKVTGTISSDRGAGPVQGEFADGKLVLKMTFDGPSGQIEIGITGAMKEDGTLAGMLDFNGQGIPWKASRVKEEQTPTPAPKPLDIAGKWLVTMELSIGPSTPGLVLKQEGETITGTYTSQRYGAYPIKGTLKAGALQFSLKMDADGTPVTMAFSGEVSADGQTIKGGVTIEGLGDGTWFAKKDKTS